MMATTDDSMEYTERLLSILVIEMSLSADMRIRVEARAKDMVEGLTNDAGLFLHDIDADKHTEDEVNTLITAFPSALSHVCAYDTNEDEQEDEIRMFVLPIQAAALEMTRNSIPFLPMLAEKGEKLNVGGEGERGGLLLEDSKGYNMLQNLAKETSADDAVCLDVFKRLRQSDLLKKQDIRQYELFWYSCQSHAKERFEYFVDWDPKALKEYRHEGEPLLHACTRISKLIECFPLMLKAGMKYYPEELGFLFRKDDNGDTACKLVFDEYGKDEAWRMIEKCLEETHDAKMIKMNSMTNLYPFILPAAGGEASDLNPLNYLLRRNPEVLFRVPQDDSLDYGVERKRKL